MTTEEVYNEFSTGSQDISAIRNMLKMFYDRAEDPSQIPKNLLLFGDASLIIKINCMVLVITFQRISHIIY